MKPTSIPGWLAAVVLLSAGCASTPRSLPVDVEPARSGAVGAREISDTVSSTPRMALSPGETFFMPRANAGNALPVYPHDLLARRLPPQSLCLRISLDEQGVVLATAPIEQPPECPAGAAQEPQFLAAAVRAARGWQFDPGVRCEYRDTAARISGDCSGGRETAQAVSLAYRFVFEQHEGRGSVRLSGDTD